MYISPKNKTISKFSNLTKSRRPLKLNDKKRYQKKFKENYAKLRNFLNHLFFMNKKYKYYNTLSPNLILDNVKNNFSPKIKEQINELITKLNITNELDEKNAVNLYIVNISSPINNFQKDMLSISRSSFYNKFDLKKNNYKNKDKNSHSFNAIEIKDKNKTIISRLRINKINNIKDTNNTINLL